METLLWRVSSEESGIGVPAYMGLGFLYRDRNP